MQGCTNSANRVCLRGFFYEKERVALVVCSLQVFLLASVLFPALLSKPFAVTEHSIVNVVECLLIALICNMCLFQKLRILPVSYHKFESVTSLILNKLLFVRFSF